MTEQGTFRGFVKFTLAFTAAFGLGIGTAMAQDYTTGAIEGIVQDQTGAVVPGASVSITSGRGVRRSAMAGALPRQARQRPRDRTQRPGQRQRGVARSSEIAMVA